MQLTTLVPLLVASASTHAFPTERRSIFTSVDILDDVLLFDAPAFPDPTNPVNTLVALQTFVSLRQIDLGPLISGVEAAVKTLGLDVGDATSTVEERLKLFAAIGLPNKTVKVNVGGCSKQAQLLGTSGLPDLGMALQNVSIGTCGAARELSSEVVVSSLDSRTFGATVFSSPDSGFGVISGMSQSIHLNIDDTVKVSNVLDTLALAKSTLIDDPVAVTGMPELYASLASSLQSPQFIYVSGSPFQLHPFLHDFISTTFSASKGPIFLQNLTLVDIPGLLDFVAGSNGILEYKLSQIDRIHGMYPNKKFLAVGDSTQKDPETYGVAFRKFGGDFISCAWIRAVDGADNTDARFSAAFSGVPENKFRIYTDNEIPSLQQIDVAGGKC
ncbi:hypothetical protein DXG01_007332 [Tephrocybe rancida]|nr:hypothetical protein DXG01_007332 [Tephrocybe rancida]